MTLEEFKNLQPGDKVVFFMMGPFRPSDRTWIDETYEAQEENGGYLIVKEIFFPDCFELDDDYLVLPVDYAWFELYKEPDRSWSYKLDY
jgi:hypothetical protein